jgi:hypothetical protein
VEVVAPGFSLLVQVHRWEELGEAVGGDADFPAGAVQQPVMVTAQQHQIAQVGGAAVGPVPDVVALTVPGWAVADGSTLSAPPKFPWARFSRPPAEPDVRLSTHPALHEVTLVVLRPTCS